jgi:hypothetical protein
MGIGRGPWARRLVGWLALLLLVAPSSRAQLPPDVAKKVAKLESQLGKKQGQLDDQQGALGTAQAALLAAQLELLVAEALPAGTPEEVKAAAKAIKAATAAVKKARSKAGKLASKASKLNAQIEDAMADIEALDPGHFDEDDDPIPPPPDPTGGNPLDPVLFPPLRAVDCGDLNGYAQPETGWSLLSESAAPADISLAPAPLDTVHVAQFFPLAGLAAFPSSVLTLDPDHVDQRRLLTSLQLADPTTLTVGGLAANTSFRVALELGALSPWIETGGGPLTTTPTDSQDVDVEGWTGADWESVALDVRCITGQQSTTWTTDHGGIVRVWVPVRTDGSGALQLRFSSSDDEPIYLAAFSVYADEDLPIVHGPDGGDFLQSSAGAANAFLAAFNAGDFDAAEEAAAAIADDWLRGVAQCYLIGWLDGTRDGRVALIESAETALVAAHLAGHAGAVPLLSQLESLQRSLAHAAAGGSAKSLICPDQGGPGFLNPDCAGQSFEKTGQLVSNVNLQIALRELSGIIAPAVGATALHDFAAWKAGTLDDSRWRPSPLLPRAMEQWGASIAVMNPQLALNANDPLSPVLLQDFEDVFDAFTDLGFAAGEFAGEVELKLLKAYADAGVHPNKFAVVDLDILAPQEIAGSWWGADVADPVDDPAAPHWANAQRQVLGLYEELVAYWLGERLSAGEFSGGQGDDIEALLQLHLLFAARRDGGDRLLASRLDDALQWSLEDTPDVTTGYHAGSLTDVEHSAEYITNPFLAARGAFGLTARAARAAFANAAELHDKADPASAFLGLNDAGRWRMRSFFFNAAGPSEDEAYAVDPLLNGRATIPATALTARGLLSSKSAPVAALGDWAEGWRDDALVSAGKPKGFPAPARWPTGLIGGAGGWHTETAVAADQTGWTSGEVSYIVGLLQAAYRASKSGDRSNFLQPIVRMLRAVQVWEDAGQPGGAIGSANWAAQMLRLGPRFGGMVAALYPDLAGDKTLATKPDPDTPGTTFVDEPLLERLRTWVSEGSADTGWTFTFAAIPAEPCGAGDAKDTSGLANAFDEAAIYYRNVWPLLTTRVMHTDRLFINPSNVLRDLTAAWTGALMTEGLPLRPMVQWQGEGLDLAVLTNHVSLTGDSWSAFVWNFADEPAAVTLRLEEGLIPGTYALEAGAATEDCDDFATPPSFMATVVKRGHGTTAALALDPGLSLVALTRSDKAAKAGGHDVAVDPPRLLRADDDSLVVRVRVLNAGGAGAPGPQLELHAVAVAADGTLGSPPELPAELMVASMPVSLGGLSGTKPAEQVVAFFLPAGSPLIELLDQGWGVQLRATVPPSSNEGDSLNNTASRVWFAQDIPDA